MLRPMLVAATMGFLVGSIVLSDEPKAKSSAKGKAEPEFDVTYIENKRRNFVLDPSFVLATGARGHLVGNNFSDVAVAVDYSAYRDLTQSLKAFDPSGFKSQLGSGEIVLLPSGTPILVLEPHTALADPRKGEVVPVEIRVLDGKSKDKKYWVRAAFIGRVVEVAVPMTAAEKARAKLKARKEKETDKPKPTVRELTDDEKAAQLLKQGDNLRPNNREAAIEKFRSVLADHPKSPSAKEATARLKSMGVKP